MPDQTANTSPVVSAFWRGIKKENEHCKHFREWQSMQGAEFIMPKSCGSETACYQRGSQLCLGQKRWNCQVKTEKK